MRWMFLLFVFVVVTTGCDQSTALSRVGLFAFARNGLVTECCSCLARQEIMVDNARDVCPDVEIPLVSDSTLDGECVDDGGVCVFEEGPYRTPCLCGDNANQCRNRLSRNGEIIVVGRCVEPNSPCETACSGVLAYPES